MPNPAPADVEHIIPVGVPSEVDGELILNRQKRSVENPIPPI